VRTIWQHGVRTFVEVGAKPTLLAIARQCVADDSATWLPTLRPGCEWQQLLATLGALYEQGREVAWERFDGDYRRSRVLLPTYPFERKRYWIDGAREPLPEVGGSGASSAAEANVDASAWLHRVEWREDAVTASVSTLGFTRPWLILGDRGGLGTAIANMLRQRGARTVTAICDSSSVRTDDGRVLDAGTPDELERSLHALVAHERGFWQGLVHLWALDESGGRNVAPSDGWRALASALFVAQRFVDAAPAGRAVFVTRHAVPPIDERITVSLEGAGIWGLVRTLRIEHPEMRSLTVDLDTDDRSTAERLVAETAADADDCEIVYRGATRFVPRLLSLAGTPRTLPPRPSFDDGAYLITGGSGGLGTAIAGWLLECGARDVVLASRRPPAVNMAAATSVAGDARVRTVTADVANPDQVRELVAAVRARGRMLRGVVHLAGVIEDSTIARLTWDRLRRVMAPKADGAWNLHQATRDQPLDFFVCFSSLAAVLGAPGQGNYAAANAAMDALTDERRRLGLPGLSIQWGPWAEIGMASRAGEQISSSRALAGIPPAVGIDLLGRLLQQSEPHWCVFRPLASGNGASLGSSDSMHRVAQRIWAVDARPESFVLAGSREAPRANRAADVPVAVRAAVASVLGGGPGNAMDGERSLSALGIDSLMGLQLCRLLSADLGVRIPPTDLYRCGTINELADHVRRLVGERSAEPNEASRSIAVIASDAGLENLTEQQIAALLDAELQLGKHRSS
jgi:acyl transferase domain-containing protein